MRVLSAAEMQACDRATAERMGKPSFELMRNAASAVAAFAREQFPQARKITVLCGRGNNGGDGMAAARLLHLAGLEVATILLGGSEGLKGDAAQAWRELVAAPGVSVHVAKSAADLHGLNPARQADLVIDAVLGTGFKPPIKGLALDGLEWMKSRRGPVLAVDLPSGWPADATSATLDSPVFPADAVITFTAPKPAHVFGALTRAWDQPVVVAPIGSPDELLISELDIAWAGSSMELVLAPRAAAANKGNFGHVLVVGGTFGSAGGKAGAPAMAALAAMRVGAGLVTAAVPAPAMPAVGAVAPELMTWQLEANGDGSIGEGSLDPKRLAALLAGKTVLALGPGLGQSPETAKFAAGLLSSTELPAVLDADALNILAAKPVLLAKLARLGKRTLVLTPHPGEMARLAATTVAEIQANRLEAARRFALKIGVTVVLKGARTLIAYPDGRVAVNTTGNPGMAKGGSGDMLTGMIAGLMAQYPNDWAQAVEAAVHLHGLAADLAVSVQNEHTLLATDSLKHLSQAFRFQSRGTNGYVWIQGAQTRGAARG
ncbi:MAG TPA: NAD(P)H-hydrate dehydratase [Terracidiphilus sp.]|nr:NAD(P)H-hydrate dehydratase [Terracidiphilus sp.]